MTITFITFLSKTCAGVHTWAQRFNNLNKIVCAGIVLFWRQYSPHPTYIPALFSCRWSWVGLTWVLLLWHWCAASEANQTQSLWLWQADLSLDTGPYWKSYSPLWRECQLQDKVKMAVAQNPYLIVANGANTIEENQYCFHIWSYITFFSELMLTSVLLSPWKRLWTSNNEM